MAHVRTRRFRSRREKPSRVRYRVLLGLRLPGNNLGDVLVPLADVLGYLDDDVTTVQLELVSILDAMALGAVRVSDEVPAIIVHHHPPVKGVELEPAILPSLVLALKVVRVEADELDDRGSGAGLGILRGGHGRPSIQVGESLLPFFPSVFGEERWPSDESRQVRNACLANVALNGDAKSRV